MNSMLATRSAGRRVRLAAAVLAGALALPGFAVANHTTCVPGSSTNGCGAFNPQLLAGPNSPYTDSISTITFRVAQPAHAQPVIDARYLVPKGWRFRTSSLRAGQVSEGPNTGDPATTCADVFINEGVNNNDDAADLGRAENLAGGVGATTRIGSSTVAFGYTRLGPTGGASRDQNPALAFVNWNETTQTALMCLYLYANTTSVPSEAQREHIIPVTLRKLAAGEQIDGVDVSTDFDWVIDLSTRSFYDKLYANGVSLTDLLFYINGETGGNWNINEVSGNLQGENFSKTPEEAGTYEFRGIFTTCSEGLVNPSGNGGDVCRNGATLKTTRSTFVDIYDAPTSTVHDYGRLLGPAGGAGLPAGYGILRGTEQATFTWRQPPVAPEESIKGYTLAVAVPGQEDTQHFEYIVTDDDHEDFDDRAPCGADGASLTCSLTLNFPLSTIGGGVLKSDGRYDVALITIYNDEHMSNGNCDAGPSSPTGEKCDPDEHRAFRRIDNKGISTWQFLIRKDAWPATYLQNISGSFSGGGGSYTAPLWVLLVDFDLRKAELVLWNALGGQAVSYKKISNGIIGDNERGGTISFDSATIAGWSVNWRFDGVSRGNAVNGFFTWWDTKGAPPNDFIWNTRHVQANRI